MGDYIVAVILGSLALWGWSTFVLGEYRAWRERQSAAVVSRVIGEGDRLDA